jgi:hypothetical protein
VVSPPADRQIAYISQGKLYLWSPDRPAQEIESEFGQSIQIRQQREQKKKVWKNRSLMEMMMPPTVAKQMQSQIQEALVKINITSICPAPQGRLLYALESNSVSGIFAFNPDPAREDRLFHNADFRVGHLAFNPANQLIACTTAYGNGLTNIATLPLDGSRPRDITEGDSIDLAPRWMGDQALVYQSAGIGRDDGGFMRSRSAFRIEQLDFQAQDITTLAEDPKSDLLGPQTDAQGHLYYIRRPYSNRAASLGFWGLLKQILWVPLRLLQAIYGFLDYFTQVYTGKPLMGALADRQTIDQPKLIKAWGDWITPEVLSQGNKAVDAEAPALVPATWQLVRQRPQREPEVIANSVLHYDLSTDGTIVYTNGSAIFKITPDGSSERIYVGKWIEFLAWV